MVDIQISNGDSIVMFTVLTDAAKEFVDEKVPLESWQWIGNSFAVEHRYADDLIAGMQDDGLVVSD